MAESKSQVDQEKPYSVGLYISIYNLPGTQADFNGIRCLITYRDGERERESGSVSKVDKHL